MERKVERRLNRYGAQIEGRIGGLEKRVEGINSG